MTRQTVGAVLLGLVLSLLAFGVYAKDEIVMRADAANGDYARLFPSPCSNTVIRSHVPPLYREGLHAGEVKIGKIIYAMCWILLGDGSIGMLYEDGEQGRLPIDAFRPETNS